MKVCQNCKKSRATVHLTEIDHQNHRRQELHLCENCARESGMPQKHDTIAISLPTAPSASASEKILSTKGTSRDLKCPECGMTWQEFRVKGRFGCANDYKVFEDALVPLLEKVHNGASRHVGVP